MKNNFYITTTTPYVNSDPHIGFALEIIAADVIARFQTQQGAEVRFNTGTDEHGQKMYDEAQKTGVTPQEYVDSYAPKFKALKELLNLSYTNFIRTTDVHHKNAAQDFWMRCFEAGDIYKDTYKVQYCVGCELEKQVSDLVDGKCPLHPTKVLEDREEENYFFRFSNYQERLLNLYRTNPTFVQPEGKMKEIVAFVQAGLQDFSISRLKEKMPWGVPVPNDPDHVMYVWFDALINYISTLGWPEDTANFEKFWPGVQIAGKDNLRQQSAMWQAMLLSAGLPNSKKILINGFISVGGQKMSKSVGNVISPAELIDRYGIDGTRYLLMHIGPIGSDMDVSWDGFDTIYTAQLSNSIGNTCSRIAKLCEGLSIDPAPFVDSTIDLITKYTSALDNFDIITALQTVEALAKQIESLLSETKPWTLGGEKKASVLSQSVALLLQLATLITPFMPETAHKISTHFSQEKITALQPLFPRLQ